MSKITMLTFKSVDDFQKTILNAINNEESYTFYDDRNKETSKKILTKNGRIYFDNNFSLSFFKKESGELFVNIEMFTLEDRFKLSKMRK